MKLFILPLLLVATFVTYGQDQLMKVWELSQGLEAPESVVYDADKNLLYVSNYTHRMVNGSTYADCYISKVDLEGHIVNKEWISHLSSPTGLFLKGRMLYIVERFGVAVFDVEQNKMLKRYHIKHDGFINDLAVDNENNIYVTDSGSEKLYRIKDNEVTEWIVNESIANANGISFIDDTLYVGVNKDNFLKSVNTATGEVTKITHLGEGNIDGVKKRGNQLIVSLYTKGLRSVDGEGKVSVLLDTEPTGLHCTDFEYIAELDMLIVPSLYDNKLIAYTFLNK